MSASIEHVSFLIRLWRERASGKSSAGKWHIEAEHVQSGQHQQFSSFDELVVYLLQVAERPEDLSSSVGDTLRNDG